MKSEEIKFMEEFLHSFVRPNANTPLYISLAGITYPNSNYHVNIHNRDVSVIEYITDGKGYVFIEDEYKEVDADTIYFLKRGEHQKYFADKKDPFTKIFLNISGPLSKEIASLYGLSNKYIFKSKELRSAFERIPQILRSSKNTDEIQIELQIVLIEILTKLSYQQSRENVSKEAIKLKEYIDGNMNRIIPNSELAKVIFRSVDYCIKLFLREYGSTPYTYQINRKIMMAKNLLTNTDISVGELGASLGYDDPHYFSNIFKAKIGLSPLNYRKRKNEICN